MFISTLKNLIEKYDLYGEHRLNALKGVYILAILETFHMMYSVSNPYFNFFYVPLTALTVEMTADTLASKYRLFFHATMGAIVAVFLFNMFVPYPLLFIIFVLCYSITHYIIALHFVKSIFVPIPIALSLAAYSLAYGELNTDFYVALNDAIISLAAMLLCLSALVLFPRSYYYRLWLRAYIWMLKQIIDNLKTVQNNQIVPVIVQGHLINMLKYANMLPRKLPVMSILKINLLVNDLRVLSCVMDKKAVNPDELNNLIEHLSLFVEAVITESPFYIHQENKSFDKMMRAWNVICLK